MNATRIHFVAGALALGAALLPSRADADYLYSVFRQQCTPDYTLRYSAADPIVSTVHIQKSEVGRVTSNYMTFGGFKIDSSSIVKTGDRVELTKAQGLLYGLRLFKEKTENSNIWEFMPYNSATVLNDCGPDKTCLFEAGKMLTDRHKRNAPRYIYTGKAGTVLTPTAGNEGAFTIPLTEPIALPLSSGIPTDTLSTLLSGLDAAPGVVALGNAWSAYIDTATGKTRIRDAMADLPTGMPTGITTEKLRSPDVLQRAKMLKWLHGESRSWSLGDIYHASAAVVEAPQRHYKDRAYPEFKAMLKKRPEMIYIGANDGMIHAFYAGPDIHYQEDGCSAPRWQAGEEAWAYLPVNMLAKTLVAVERGHQRFFSQDLSCRFTDVQVNTSFTTCTSTDQASDRFCGWRTVLVCGQGWGGSWYVGLDVTDPLNPFRDSNGVVKCSRNPSRDPMRPMWEFTHHASSTTPIAMGRTWSLPSIGLVNFDGTPKWLATLGSGYNTDMRNCPKFNTNGNNANRCEAISGVPFGAKTSFRMLNLDWDGAYPYHGDGVQGTEDKGKAWVLDVANGSVLKWFDIEGQQAVVADIPAVDSDFNGLIDAAYVAGWDGKLGRIHFGDTRTTLASIGMGSPMCTVATTAGQRVLASHPTAFGVPPRSTDTFRNRVMIVQGTGLNTGDDPDQQRNSGNFWDIEARVFTDDGSSTCPSSSSVVCAANNWWNVNVPGNEKPRLLGAPIFSRQANGDDWLVYTTWSPPSANGNNNNCSDQGVARLWCLDVTAGSSCKECNGFTAQGTSYSIVLYNGEQPPSSPVSADGNIYVSGKDGPIKQAITNSAGQAPNPNSFSPTTAVAPRVVSWREVF